MVLPPHAAVLILLSVLQSFGENAILHYRMSKFSAAEYAERIQPAVRRWDNIGRAAEQSGVLSPGVYLVKVRVYAIAVGID